MSDRTVLDEIVVEEHPAALDALRGMFTRDFLYLAVSALQSILATFVTPVLTRRVGVSEFGQFALAIAVMQILGPILSFGLPFAAQKIFADADGDRQARGVLAAAVAAALGAALLAALAAPLWGPAVGLNDLLDARLAALWGACFALTWTSLAMLRSRDALGKVILLGGLQSVGAQAAGVALLFLWKPTLTSYLSGVIIGQGSAALIGLMALRPDWSAAVRIRSQSQAFLFGLPMVVQQLSVYILYAGDRIVVRHDIGSAATGRYSVAYNIGSLGALLLVFANQAWMPRVYAVADRAARSQLLASSRDMMHALQIPVVCGLAAVAPLVLQVWAPGSFDPTKLTIIVAIVALYTFPFGEFLANVRALMSEGKTGRAAATTVIGAAVNVGLNLLLVPLIGLTGSAIATVLSYGLLARLSRPSAGSRVPVPGVPRLLAGLIIASAGVTLLMGLIPTSNEWLAVRIAVFLAAAVVFLLLIRRLMSGHGAPGGLVMPVAG